MQTDKDVGHRLGDEFWGCQGLGMNSGVEQCSRELGPHVSDMLLLWLWLLGSRVGPTFVSETTAFLL